MAVEPTGSSNDATIAFTLASDELAEQVRASYAAVGASDWTTLLAVPIPTSADAAKPITVSSLPTGIWRFRLEAGEQLLLVWQRGSAEHLAGV